MALHEDPGAYLGPAIAAGVPAYLSYRGQQRTNAQNLMIAREQMSFQERMSSTAYQRSMEDMKAAGLNPMLAYQQGGASTPGGASADMESALGEAVSSAQEGRRVRADLKNIEENTKLAKERQLSEQQGRDESRGRTFQAYKHADIFDIQRRIFELQLPALQNAARVENTRLGGTAAFMDRIRQSLFGGRGFFNPVGR